MKITNRRLALCLAVLLLLPVGCSEPDADRPAGADGRVQVLIEGSPFRGTNGVAWGPDNMIYQGSVWSDAAFRVDPESGEIHRIEGSHGSDDLAFHPDGRLYLNFIVRGEVGRRLPGGEMGIAGKVKPGNDGIAISKEGRLFVSGLFVDTHLWEVDPDGKRAPRMICNQGKRMSNGMAFGPDGKLYGSSWETGEVIRIDTETGKTEAVATNVGIPSAVKFNSKGELHVMNTKEGSISKVDMKTGALELVARLPYPATDNFCFSPDDRIFASSSGDGYLWEVTGKDTQRVVVHGGLGLPGGVALVKAQGRTNLMVVDLFAIRKFDPESGDAISAVRDVTMATDVGWMLTLSQHGKQLLASSWTGNFIKIWDPEKDAMVVNFDKFKAPTNAISLGEDIVFCDLAGSVVRFSAKSPDKTTTITKGLKQPFGLAYADGDLYVSEDLGGRIVQIMEGGKIISPRVVKQDLRGPQGLAIMGGKLYAVEAGAGRLLAIDLATGDSRVVADGMQFATGAMSFELPLSWARASIVVSGNTAYIAGTSTGRIYKVTL